jgi:thiosulfate dehydrogenase [quinone] large subunit
MSAYKKSFLLARLAIGTSLFGHGLARLPKLDKFSHGMAGQFQHSILPHPVVIAFGYALPFAEFGIGLLLLIGLFTRTALVAGAIMMILLLFGTTTIEQWDAIPAQLIHAAYLVVLLIFVDRYDSWSLDLVLRRGNVNV